MNVSFKEPVTVELGRTQRYRQRGFTSTLVDQPENFQYIPLIEGLNALFDNEEFVDEVSRIHNYTQIGGIFNYVYMRYIWVNTGGQCITVWYYIELVPFYRFCSLIQDLMAIFLIIAMVHF